jgi:hypothetical protein
MTAIMIGLLSVSVGAAISVGYGSVIVGDVLMGFGLFSGIKGLVCALRETLRSEGGSDAVCMKGPRPRPAARPEGHPAPRAPQAVPLCRCAGLR